MAQKRTTPKQQVALTKLFVLDTNVLMHDPSSLLRFQEHDIYLPMMTLEELDDNKKGMTEVARNARQASRFLDQIVSDPQANMEEGISLAPHSGDAATGRLFIQTYAIKSELPAALPSYKGDNQILAVMLHLQRTFAKRQVILVSKDINMRIKARALGFSAEDYFNDKVLEDTDLLYGGTRQLPEDFWDLHGKGMESWQENTRTFYRIKGPLCRELLINEFVYQEGAQPLYAQVREQVGNGAVLETIKDFTHAKNNIWGITARNREQNFALNLLMNPDLIRSRIKIKSLNFMRGRTFLNKFLIIDEAQNLTPKQMKTLITRAGPGTKVICLGNIAQIDTPYLTEGSSGITYVVDRFKGWLHGGHVTLMRGERSRLADHAAEVL
jgi:PhoH-like ATPase